MVAFSIISNCLGKNGNENIVLRRPSLRYWIGQNRELNVQRRDEENIHEVS